MASNSREWSIPTPVRALLWWPATAFVLVMVAPDIAPVTIVASGALLVAVGGMVAAGAHRLREMRRAAASATTVGAAASTTAVTMAEVTAVVLDPTFGPEPYTDPPTVDFPVVDASIGASSAA